MDDRRQDPRYTPTQELAAYDLHSTRLLGRVVDISEHGFLLFCPQPIDAESIWHLHFLAAQAPHLNSVLTLGAECLWVRPANQAEHCWAGFQIIDIAPEETEKLRALFPSSP